MTPTTNPKLTCPHCHQPIPQHGIKLSGLYVLRDTRSAKITNIEAAIFTLLLQRFNLYVRMNTLVDHLYALDPEGGPAGPESNIRVRVHTLRRKLKPLGISIETAWGFGYKLHVPPLEPTQSACDTPPLGTAAFYNALAQSS